MKAETELLNFAFLVKENEKFWFLYDDESAAALLRQLGIFAADNELDFTWYDAAVVSQKVGRAAGSGDPRAAGSGDPRRAR